MSDQGGIENNSQLSGNAEVVLPIEQIKKYFSDLNIQYSVVGYQWPNKASSTILIDGKEVPLEHVLKAILFKYSKQYLLVITCMPRLLDYVMLSREMECENLSCDIEGTYVGYYDTILNSYCPAPAHL